MSVAHDPTLVTAGSLGSARPGPWPRGVRAVPLRTAAPPDARAGGHAADDSADGPWLPPGRTVELPGRGTTFVREIEGPAGAPTVLLLHGLGATADLNWFSSYGPLAGRFHVIAVDHRGHGRGIADDRPFTLEDAADDAAALLGALGIEQAIVVGYSMGGPIAQLLWHRHPAVVTGLVLCATAGEFSGSRREHCMFAAVPVLHRVVRLAPDVARWMFERTHAASVLAPHLRPWARREHARFRPLAVLEAASALGRFTSRDWIGGVDVPTSVVVTLRDHVVPTARQSRLADAIPGATVYGVNTDHLAPVLEPREFVPQLVRAIGDVVDRVPALARRAAAPRRGRLTLVAG